VNVQLGGGGDEVIVLASLELQCVWHRGEGPEGDREESEKNIINIGKKLTSMEEDFLMLAVPN
jgi:hypothetical protein